MQPSESESSQKQKRTHHRSPGYPMLNLEQAVEKSRMLYNEDKRSFAPRPVIVRHLGYKDENSGIGNRELSALRQYDLLEEKDGEYRVSDIAYALLFLSEASEERGAALSRAALSPAIFKELWVKYRNDVSNDTMSDFLIHKKGFNPASVNQVVENYRASILFANLTELTYTEEDGGQTDMEEVQTPPEDALRSHLIQKTIEKTLIARTTPTVTRQYTYTWPLSKNVMAEVKLIGPEVTPEHIEMLRKYLDLAKMALDLGIEPEQDLKG